MYYSAIGILAIFLLLIENRRIIFEKSAANQQPKRKAYMRFIFAVFAYYLTDVLWGFLEALKLARPLFWDTSLYFFAMACGVLCWTDYIVTYLEENNPFGKILRNSGRFFAAAVGIITIVNIFVPLLFTVDDTCKYEALPARHVLLGIQITMLLFVSVYAYTSLWKHKENRQRYRALVLFGLIMVGCLLAQLRFPYLPLYTIAYLLGTTLLSVYVVADETAEYRQQLEQTKKIAALKKETAQALAAYQKLLNENSVRESVLFAMTQDYFNIFYINVDTDAYIEYGSRTKENNRAAETRGKDFFRTISENAVKLVYEEDRDALIQTLTKDNLLRELEQNGVFKYYYRLMLGGTPTYVSLKVTRIPGDEQHLIIGITNVDAQMKDRLAAAQAKEENKAYLRLSAFSRSLLVLYVIDPETGEYTEFSSSKDYAQFGIAKKGSDFFGDTEKNAKAAVYSEDTEHFFSMFTKENIAHSIALDGIFVLDYRLMIDGKPTYIRLKASEVEEDEKKLLVVGIENVDKYIRREQQQAYDLSVAREQATKDALTGIKNHLAFAQAKQRLIEETASPDAAPYAFVVCDLNNLKQVNDTQGHQSGDTFIRTACTTICNIFRHSPVFRIGGDEFAVISRGNDFEKMDELLAQMDAANESADDIQIAYGMARSNEGDSVETVFELADQRMYKHKARLKSNEPG